MTIRELTELARFEFRRYGFRADGGIIYGKTDRVDVDFTPEPSTRQAAFSQSSVTPRFGIWHQNNGDATWDSAIKPTDSVVDLGVSYKHYGTGSNGYVVRYELVQHPFGDPPVLRRAQ
jgi:hypothetical protein